MAGARRARKGEPENRPDSADSASPPPAWGGLAALISALGQIGLEFGGNVAEEPCGQALVEIGFRLK
jgi:hypothetical protein